MLRENSWILEKRSHLLVLWKHIYILNPLSSIHIFQVCKLKIKYLVHQFILFSGLSHSYCSYSYISFSMEVWRKSYNCNLWKVVLVLLGKKSLFVCNLDTWMDYLLLKNVEFQKETIEVGNLFSYGSKIVV